MKSLVVFYSRTGNTRKIAEAIAGSLGSDVEEIFDTQKRSGLVGFLRSIYQARGRKLTVLKNIKNDPSAYDLIIIGTPVWSGNVSTPTRTYIRQVGEKFNSVAFFCTYGGSGLDGTLEEMQELCGISPINTLGVRAKEIGDGKYKSKIEQFVKEIQ